MCSFQILSAKLSSSYFQFMKPRIEIVFAIGAVDLDDECSTPTLKVL